jgi:hypothetical protein
MVFGKHSAAIQRKIDERHEVLLTRLEAVETAVHTSSETSAAQVYALEKAFEQLSLRFSSELNVMKSHLDAISVAREQVEKSTRSFSDVQRKIENVVHDQLGTAINASVENLKLDAGKYDAVKRDIDMILLKMKQLNEEIVKFQGISKQIKQGDFELLKFARELEKTDNDRVRLLKQVDDLQRLVARMRRSQR